MRRIGIFAAALLAPAAAAAETPSPLALFCAELKRVVMVSKRGDFASLGRSRTPPRLGFSRGCSASISLNDSYWICHQFDAPQSMRQASLAARVGAGCDLPALLAKVTGAANNKE